MARFSTRFLVITAMVATGTVAQLCLIALNRDGWHQEQQHIMLGNAVRWDERSYIPNLQVEYSSTLPAWLTGMLPGDQAEVFDRVTTIDVVAGPAHPEDFRRCLVFQHVETIRMGTYYDADRLVAEFARFPRLRTIEVWNPQSDGDRRSIVEAAGTRLPGVNVVVK